MYADAEDAGRENVGTVLLAGGLLAERIGPAQLAGPALAAVTVSLLALG